MRLGDERWKLALADYLRAVRPVASIEEGRSDDGLFHTLGNIEEWTETIHLELSRVRTAGGTESSSWFTPQPAWRIIKGRSWRHAYDLAARLDVYTPMPATFSDETVGFRCARSVRR